MTLVVTTHGARRVRKRLGLPKRSVKRMAAKALEYGTSPRQCSRKLRQYLQSKQHDAGNGQRSTIRLYGKFYFVFRDNSLITACELPREFLCRKAGQK